MYGGKAGISVMSVSYMCLAAEVSSDTATPTVFTDSRRHSREHGLAKSGDLVTKRAQTRVFVLMRAGTSMTGSLISCDPIRCDWLLAAGLFPRA